MKWVQTHISKFGGDPDQVTIFGESAGGISIMAHLVSPWSKGLFQKAIGKNHALKIYDQFVQNTSCFCGKITLVGYKSNEKIYFLLF